MQETFEQISNQVTEKWGELSKAQRIKIYIGVVALIVTIGIIGFLAKPENKILYRNIDLKQASEVTAVLSEQKIKYKLLDGGTTIEVDEKQFNEAKLVLARENVPKGQYTFDDAITNSMSTTQDEKKAKMNHLKKVELESLLESIDSIQKAQVTLVIPEEKNSFIQSKQQSSASVVLTLNKELTSQEAELVARLVASGVQNLDMGKITIIDSNGKNVFVGSDEGNLALGKQQELKGAAESSIKSKIIELLGIMYDDVRIGSNLVLNFDRYEEVKEEYTPQFEENSRGIIQKENVSSSSSKNTQNGAEPGVANNGGDAPNYQIGNGTNGESKSDTKEVTYVTDKKVSTSVKNVGDIDFKASSLAVSLFKNKLYQQQTIEPTLAGMTWEQFKEQNKDQKIIAVDEATVASIKSATGIDNVVVQAYEKPIFVDQEPYSINYKDYLPFILILLILIMIVIAVMKFRKHEDVVEVEPELEVEEMLKAAKDQVELDEIELKETLETKRQIDKFVDEKPEAVANLLRNWLTEDDWE
ncbi:flagellar basal-body MS-ring/collar protein FliF [Cellulosilyticum sp. I15G10I2]|uniref:flagellar basal-body MS-ring/collar protein FliF n=1 Tax=Cellulosilyticum sp. I15G10I2 TaxID=1892843 RepID=UPI00085C858F|nr:flagellar basal-body MS-ring/collar protein FliF [Cellulosilyticum sp. I15G10I2]